jgi:acetoin utilization deacetylase AcuC-like enzyme
LKKKSEGKRKTKATFLIKVAWDPIYVHSLPEKHRFPMEKYELLPQQLLHEGTLEQANFFSPSAVSTADILAIHTADYWKQLSNLNLNRQEQLRSGFPHSKLLIEREKTITGGSIQAAKFAIENGVAFNIAGGTHHAYADRAEGFCLLNDIAIASSYLLRNNLVKQILVIDLDVHQGNGTAKIFEKEKRVFTFSMHAEHNYPLRKESSDIDVGVEDGTKGKEYIDILSQHLPALIDKVNPDFIFFQSGVDILETDKLGRLKVSIEDCKKRDNMVLSLAKYNNIPLMACMGGGYSPEIKHIIEPHANTYRLAVKLFT